MIPRDGRSIRNKLGFKVYELIGDVVYKRCSKCNEQLPHTDKFFWKRKKLKFGLDVTCKECRQKIRRINKPLSIQIKENGDVWCSKCKTYKNIINFTISNNKWCVERRNGLNVYCKTCDAAKSKKYIQDDSKDKLKGLISSLVCGMRKRSEKRGWEFLLKSEDILDLYNKQNGFCVISGIKMTTFTGKGNVKTNISVDRKSSLLGYTIENTQLVCDQINRMKFKLETDEMIELCKKIIDYQTIKYKEI